MLIKKSKFFIFDKGVDHIFDPNFVVLLTNFVDVDFLQNISGKFKETAKNLYNTLPTLPDSLKYPQNYTKPYKNKPNLYFHT